MRPVRIIGTALREIDATFEYYERQKDGLGGEFYGRVEEAIERIELNPEGYEVRFDGLRRCNLEQFPYALWFSVQLDKSVVVACFHGKRHARLAKERALGVIPFSQP